MKNKKNEKLFRLDELSDYKVASGDPNVKGWKVKDKEGRVVGVVESMIANKEIEKIVYLDVNVDSSIIEANHEPLDKSAKDGIHEFQNEEGEDHLIIPIGLARLNEDEEFVYTEKLTHQMFAATKRYDRSKPVPVKYEEYIVRHLGSGKKSDGDFYDRDEFKSPRYKKKVNRSTK